MDTRSVKSVPRHEEMYSGAAYVNCTKAQRRADNAPMRSKGGDKCSPFDSKGLPINTNLFCQPCFTSPRDKLQFDRKSGLSISARHKKAEKVPLSKNKKADALSKITSTSFAHLTKQVLVETLKIKSIEKREILAIVEEEGYCWMTPLIEYLMEGTLPEETIKAHAIKIKARQ
ncbi:hypothetical protein Tco_0938484 [Tanacetum coccineum]|uniref:Uncharacterized protein n=1 Tax=Tanacetum coccineum TaxID=301880 RepID=A0ABQ5DPA6_9ASTR